MASTTPATTHPCGTPYSASGIPPADASPARAKFEPPDGFAYFGFTFRLWDWRPLARNDVWGDVRPFAERLCDAIRVELAGKTPTIITVHSAWPSRPERPGPFRATLAEIRKVHAAAGPTVVPRLEWQSDRATTREIASGAFDDYIYRYARGVRRYGQPLFIRPICGEFNGFWWQWCSPEANHDLTAADFVNAWRRVVDIFRREGVNNVAWIWTPVAFPPPPENWGHDPDWQAYYPGDDYVDWVGGDLNDWGLPSWLDPLYRFGLDHDKPFFLAEFAIRHEGTEWTHEEHLQWLTSMFDYFEAHPQIKAISYFNYKNNPDHTLGSVDHVYLYDGKVSYVPNVNDHDQRLIAGGEDVRALFASRIADPRYISTVLIEPRRRWRDLEPDEKTASDQARAAPVADPLIDPSEAIPPAAVHEPNRTRRRSQRRHPQEGRGGRPRRDQVAATWTTRDDDRVAGAIVGRTSEIGAFERLLADEIPQPRALLIEGEPGIGKTTLFDGLLEMARGRDCQILSCRPARSEMDPSYVGLMELLGGVSEEVVRSLPPPQARVLNPDPSPRGAGRTVRPLVAQRGRLGADPRLSSGSCAAPTRPGRKSDEPLRRRKGGREALMRWIRNIAVTAGLAVALAGCSSSSNNPTSTSASTKAPAASSTTPVPSSTPAATGELSGTWSGQYGGAYQGTFVLDWQQSGTNLSGTIKLSSPAQTLSINGSVEGGDIRFGTVGSTAITYSGSVSGNSMSGTYKVQGGTGSAGGSWSAAKSS